MKTDIVINIHFSHYFRVAPALLEAAGAFNVSLINDLPLFIDPFLLFNSKKQEYQALHDQMIRYLRFLRDKSTQGAVTEGLLKAWFTFSEVKQTWLGFSRVGNDGRGLGSDFAHALNQNLYTVFSSFGSEEVTQGSHLEKLCLIREGVGRDNISDFTTNLIKEYLLEYTQDFARKHIRPELRRNVVVGRVRFNYSTETWESDTYDLPFFNGDYVLLTPKDILAKDEIWINKNDLVNDYNQIAESIPNDQLRDQVNNYFLQVLPEKPTIRDWRAAVNSVLRKFPELVEYYIRYKEDNGDRAVSISEEKVAESELLYVQQIREFAATLLQTTDFYQLAGNTPDEVRARVDFLKDVIENKGGHRLFYVGGVPIRREEDLHILFRLTWFATPSDVSREVNDGRGPADFKISRGSLDKTIVEFKLASNTQLKRNLEKQAAIYQKASDAKHGFKVIVFFSQEEYERVISILRDLKLEGRKDVVLIDARDENKPSASKA